MTTDTLLTTQNKILLILDRINEIQDKAETIQHVEIQENYTEQYINDMIAQLIPRVKDTLFQINQITLIPQFPTNSQPRQILQRIHTISNHVQIQQKNYTKDLNADIIPQIISLTNNTLLELRQLTLYLDDPRTIQKLPDSTQKKTHRVQQELLNTIYDYLLNIYNISDHILKPSRPLSTFTPPAK